MKKLMLALIAAIFVPILISGEDEAILALEMNRHVGLRLEHPESFRLGRSDHTAFYYANVPIMYLFGGKDPDYHSPRDTWDKLLPEKVD